MQDLGVWCGVIRSRVVERILEGGGKRVEVDRGCEVEGGDVSIGTFSGRILAPYLRHRHTTALLAHPGPLSLGGLMGAPIPPGPDLQHGIIKIYFGIKCINSEPGSGHGGIQSYSFARTSAGIELKAAIAS